MTTPVTAQSRAVAVPARVRIRACLSQRHHVESLTLILIILVIQSLVELHEYSALGLISLLTVGCRDILLVLLFAEEEGLITHG
jgi:hypothetical protein